MANIMTKRGQLDNVVTYQHFCDTTADLANIKSQYCTLGSIAIVLQGNSGGLQIYIANSDKQWNPLTSGIGGGNGGGVTNLPLEIVNPSNNDVLTYDSTSEKWVNKAPTNDSFRSVLVVHSVYDEQQGMSVLDKTGQTILDALQNEKIILYTFTREVDGTIYQSAQSESAHYLFYNGKHYFFFSGNMEHVLSQAVTVSYVPASTYQADTLNDYPVMINDFPY